MKTEPDQCRGDGSRRHHAGTRREEDAGDGTGIEQNVTRKKEELEGA